MVCVVWCVCLWVGVYLVRRNMYGIVDDMERCD